MVWYYSADIQKGAMGMFDHSVPTMVGSNSMEGSDSAAQGPTEALG